MSRSGVFDEMFSERDNKMLVFHVMRRLVILFLLMTNTKMKFGCVRSGCIKNGAGCGSSGWHDWWLLTIPATCSNQLASIFQLEQNRRKSFCCDVKAIHHQYFKKSIGSLVHCTDVKDNPSNVVSRTVVTNFWKEKKMGLPCEEPPCNEEPLCNQML